jgi:hypothetical protein
MVRRQNHFPTVEKKLQSTTRLSASFTQTLSEKGEAQRSLIANFWPVHSFLELRLIIVLRVAKNTNNGHNGNGICGSINLGNPVCEKFF